MKVKSKVAAVYRKIENAGFKCALSGWTISPELFELDHIVPLSKGGSNEVENLQALHPLVNRAKGTMTNDEFVEMCIAVASCYKKSQATLQV